MLSSNPLYHSSTRNTIGTVLWLFIFISAAISMFLLICHCIGRELIDDQIELLGPMLTICGGALIILELIKKSSVSEGEFLANLNQMFVSNEDYKKAYRLLQAYAEADEANDKSKKEKAMKMLKEDMEVAEISNYLTFFEVFQLLRDKNTLKIDMFDDLFAYRFFLAVHNPYIQEKKLLKVPENFRNIYVLEHDWIEYRQEKGRKTHGMEYCLEEKYKEKFTQSRYLKEYTENGYSREEAIKAIEEKYNQLIRK